jgi:hypothetical protein
VLVALGPGAVAPAIGVYQPLAQSRDDGYAAARVLVRKGFDQRSRPRCSGSSTSSYIAWASCTCRGRAAGLTLPLGQGSSMGA